jgi:hypothetical protein
MRHDCSWLFAQKIQTANRMHESRRCHPAEHPASLNEHDVRTMSRGGNCCGNSGSAAA